MLSRCTLLPAQSLISSETLYESARLRVLLTVALLAVCMHGRAQEYLLDVQYFGIENGLSQRDVECIQQDKQGFMWLGTNYGLNRFDGYSFKWFTQEKHGLQSNTINHILQDDEGWLWLFYTGSRVFHTPQSIDLFNPATEEVISLEEKFGHNLPFNFKDISSFIAAPDGRLAFVTTQKKLILYSHKKGFEVSELNVYPLFLEFFSKHNTIWGYSSKADPALRDVVVEIGLNGKERNRYLHDVPFQFNFIANVDKDDRLWYISKYWQNHEYESQQGKMYVIDPNGIEREFLLENTDLPPGAIHFDKSVNVYNFWMNPQNGSFWLFETSSFQGFNPSTGWYRNLSTAYKGLAQPNTVYFDNRNRTWIGTEFGVYIIDLRKNPFQTIIHHHTADNPSTFRGITEDKQGTIWACIDRGYGWLARFKRQNGRYTSDISDWEKSDWGAGNKYGIFTDRKGYVWFGSGYNSVMTRYNPADGTYRKFAYAIPRKVGDQQVNIWSFFEDKDGQVWFGSDAGMIGCVIGQQSVIILPELEGVNSKGGCIYQFFEDKKGRVWVATDAGMFRLEMKTTSIRPFQPDGFPLLRAGILHIHEDADGSFWLGTKGLGLVRWHPDTGVWQQFTKADGLSNNTIYAVYEDTAGNLWLSSDYGIIQFNKTTHRTRAYLEKDGLANQEFNRIAHYQSQDGTLYFGGINGMTVFNPADLTGDSTSAAFPLVVAGLEQFDGEHNQLVDKLADLRTSNAITLRPGDLYFRLEFALLAYSDAGNIQYAYFIEGVDKQCTYQRENSIRFNRLPYGRHLLRIKAQAPNGQWSENEVAIQLIVLKPFYLQTWFLVVAVASLLAAAWAFYQWRLGSLQAQRYHLERVVAERTHRISEDKKIIEQQNEALQSLEQLKSRFFANVSHELRTPLTLLLGPVHSLLKRSEHADGETSQLLHFIERNVRHLQKLINEILDLSKLEDNKMQVTEEAVHFHAYLREQMAQFYSAAQSNDLHFDLQFLAEPSLRILLDKSKFEKILHNFCSNALKFTPRGGKITISIKETKGQLLLRVEDTGRGIHPDDLPHVFDRFYQSSQPDAPIEGGTGIGLSLVKELAELLGGFVGVESEYGRGSVFYFRFSKKEIQAAPDTPLADAPDLTLSASAVPPGRLGKPAPLHSQPGEISEMSTILIVEDNADLLQYLQFLLSGCRVITAEHGQAALEVLESRHRNAEPTDLIISDLMMPVMDGFQLLERLKTDDRWRHLPVIMLTAKVNAQARLQALRIGVDDYLTKPFEEAELKARIDNLLRNYRKRMAFFSGMESVESQADDDTRPFMAQVDAEWLREVESIFLQYMSDSRLNVDFAAGKINLSERQFHRRLKQLTGLTPNQYLQEIRLHRAKDLLSQGAFATVKEVVMAVGFQDVRHFSELFQKHFRRRPSEMRN